VSGSGNFDNVLASTSTYTVSTVAMTLPSPPASLNSVPTVKDVLPSRPAAIDSSST
jgi:hypothetical protein